MVSWAYDPVQPQLVFKIPVITDHWPWHGLLRLCLGSSDISEEAPEERGHKKSLETEDTIEVDRKSEDSDDSDETIDDIMDDKSEKIVRLPLKLLSVETIEENVSSTEIILWIETG